MFSPDKGETTKSCTIAPSAMGAGKRESQREPNRERKSYNESQRAKESLRESQRFFFFLDLELKPHFLVAWFSLTLYLGDDAGQAFSGRGCHWPALVRPKHPQPGGRGVHQGDLHHHHCHHPHHRLQEERIYNRGGRPKICAVDCGLKMNQVVVWELQFQSEMTQIRQDQLYICFLPDSVPGITWSRSEGDKFVNCFWHFRFCQMLSEF